MERISRDLLWDLFLNPFVGPAWVFVGVLMLFVSYSLIVSPFESVGLWIIGIFGSLGVALLFIIAGLYGMRRRFFVTRTAS